MIHSHEPIGARWRRVAGQAAARAAAAAWRLDQRVRPRMAARGLELAAISALLLLLVVLEQMSFAAWAVGIAGIAVLIALSPDGREGRRLPARAESGTEPRLHVRPALDSASEAGPGWHAIVDTMADAVVALDAAGTVIHHNPPAAEMFPKLRTGQPISHVSRAPELLAAIDRAGSAADAVTVELQDRVPVERRVAARIASLPPDAHFRLPATLVVFRDLSEPDRLAQMRADFITNASHELRTPLASLRGFVETLQGPARNDANARERFLAIMAKEAGRMTRLIDDLLSLSRAELRVHVPPKGIVDLNDVVGFVAQTLDAIAAEAEIRLSVTRLPAAARVRGEREELVQVFQNLVHNAIKYGRKGGTVKVRVLREPEGSVPRLAVAVIDDGPGIAPEHLPRLTERFYRVSAAVSRDKGGTGLGLAIVKHIVNRHRGELRIQSEIGKGSRFTVVLDEMTAAAPAVASRRPGLVKS